MNPNEPKRKRRIISKQPQTIFQPYDEAIAPARKAYQEALKEAKP